jgi:circadian clock protein KaiB
MRAKSAARATAAYAAKATQSDDARYVLRLYVAGMTPGSMRAVASIKTICDEHLAGRYELDVIDLYQQPVLAKGDQIVATPTLIKHLPTPLRRLIGDLSDTERVLVGLNLKPKPKRSRKA